MADGGPTLESQIGELLDQETFDPPEDFAEQAVVSDDSIYETANEDYEGFWAEQAEALHWDQKWDQVLDWSDPPNAKWFAGGKLNVSYNCLDRHVEAGNGDRVAFHWRGEEGEELDVTYADLLRDVQRFANALKDRGIGKGDVVGIFLPMIPEVVVAMLACARIGAPHNVVFGGFSAESVKERMEFSEAKALVTVDGARRKGKTAPVKESVDEVIGDVESIETIFVVKRVDNDAPMTEGRDVWYHDALEAADDECEAEPLDSEHPLYILYSSGSTAKPKGILHTTGGYLTGVAYTHKVVFDLKPEEDVFWCSADVGWVTGHSYIVYGPLANGATSVMYEGAPDYPDKDIWWELVDRYGVTIFYTAPTAIRACIKWGAEYPEKHDLSSLRLLGSVGEPINPKAWLWYYKVIGGERCPIVDTWWQTETGHIMITTMPGVQPAKPGSAGKPLPGIEAQVVTEEGEDAGTEQGLLTLRRPWPGMLRTLYKDEDRFVETYWEQVRQGHLLRRRRRAQGRRRLLLDHRARRRRDQRLRPPALDRRGRVGDRLPREGRRVGRDRPAGRGQRPVDHRVRHALGRPRGRRRHGRRHPRARRQADRQARAAEADHLGRRPAQDALGQDHAPPAARHRRGARAGRRHDAARPGRDAAARGQGRRAPEGGGGVIPQASRVANAFLIGERRHALCAHECLAAVLDEVDREILLLLVEQRQEADREQEDREQDRPHRPARDAEHEPVGCALRELVAEAMQRRGDVLEQLGHRPLAPRRRPPRLGEAELAGHARHVPPGRRRRPRRGRRGRSREVREQLGQLTRRHRGERSRGPLVELVDGQAAARRVRAQLLDRMLAVLVGNAQPGSVHRGER